MLITFFKNWFHWNIFGTVLHHLLSFLLIPWFSNKSQNFLIYLLLKNQFGVGVERKECCRLLEPIFFGFFCRITCGSTRSLGVMNFLCIGFLFAVFSFLIQLWLRCHLKTPSTLSCRLEYNIAKKNCKLQDKLITRKCLEHEP